MPGHSPCFRALAMAPLALCAAIFLSCSRDGASQTQDTSPEQPARVDGLSRAGTGEDPLQRLLARNLDARVSLPIEVITTHMQAWKSLPVGDRIAKWAELFLQRGDAEYLFGLKPGGYVADGLLVQDYKQDCVLFFYRCTDLALSHTPTEAIQRALDSRFFDAPAAEVVDETGAVDYEHPKHLDYSLDIIRSGIWGRDVSRHIGEAVADTAGTSRYPARSFWYIPTSRMRLDNFRNGDLLFFVLDEGSERGRKLRDDYGLVIGHQGIVQVADNGVHAIHAASSDLPGEYEGNRIVRVLLRTYLERVESYKGVIVTRIEDEASL